MNSELKEGEEIKGKDEFGNEFIEKRIGRVIERHYLGIKIVGKPVVESYPVGKAPDISIDVNKTEKGGYSIIVKLKGDDFEKGGNLIVSKDFLRNNKEQEKFYRHIEDYFKGVLVQAEIYPILMNVKDKIAELENKEKGEPYSFLSKAVEKKPSAYIVIGVDENGKPIKKEWSEFEKEVLEEHKGYNAVKREV